MYNYIKEQLNNVHLRILQAANRAGRDSDDIKLVAVSKRFPVEAIQEAYNAGQRLFGENKVQELIEKVPRLPDDIQWHHIGHLQSNKVAPAVKLATLIEAVDSEKLLNRIDRLALDNNKIENVLLEINISGEVSKFGESQSGASDLVAKALDLKNIKLQGLMTMAPAGSSECKLRNVFSTLRELRYKLEDKFKIDLPELSMGMSSDFEIAIEEGATIVRVGTSIFGQRDK